MPRPELTIAQILAWADAYYERTGKWPNVKCGRVLEPADEKWTNIDQALRVGLRGLNPGQSLARLLAKRRGKRNRRALPSYSHRQILAWADAFHARHGRWPRCGDGSIADAPGETWYAVDTALRNGQRGLPGGHSLARLLSAKRGISNRGNLPRLSHKQILSWADSYRKRNGTWPLARNEAVVESPQDSWHGINQALYLGRRGLRQGSSLPRLLARYRGVTRHVRRPPLHERQILAWADAYNDRTTKWPNSKSGAIPESPGESWRKIEKALRCGTRGLPGNITLAKLLAKRRGARYHLALPPLTEEKILRWARAYKRQTGRWPNRDSGPIPNSRGESWGGIRHALNHARRSLKRRTTLKELLESRG